MFGKAFLKPSLYIKKKKNLPFSSSFKVLFIYFFTFKYVSHLEFILA